MADDSGLDISGLQQMPTSPINTGREEEMKVSNDFGIDVNELRNASNEAQQVKNEFNKERITPLNFTHKASALTDNGNGGKRTASAFLEDIVQMMSDNGLPCDTVYDVMQTIMNIVAKNPKKFPGMRCWNVENGDINRMPWNAEWNIDTINRFKNQQKDLSEKAIQRFLVGFLNALMLYDSILVRDGTMSLGQSSSKEEKVINDKTYQPNCPILYTIPCLNVVSKRVTVPIALKTDQSIAQKQGKMNNKSDWQPFEHYAYVYIDSEFALNLTRAAGCSTIGSGKVSVNVSDKVASGDKVISFLCNIERWEDVPWIVAPNFKTATREEMGRDQAEFNTKKAEKLNTILNGKSYNELPIDLQKAYDKENDVKFIPKFARKIISVVNEKSGNVNYAESKFIPNVHSQLIGNGDKMCTGNALMSFVRVSCTTNSGQNIYIKPKLHAAVINSLCDIKGKSVDVTQ